MVFDAFSILTGGMHNMNDSLTNGYISVVSIEVTPTPPILPPAPPLRVGGGGGGGFDPTYKPNFEPATPQVVKSVEEIAELLHHIEDGEIMIRLEYKPRNHRNAIVECQLLEQKITAELVSRSSRNIVVEMIYTKDDK